MDKSALIQAFPGLATDDVFKNSLMSPEDSDYNCLAWAYQMFKDRWMWPPIKEDGNAIIPVDGKPWWPKNVRVGLDVECLVEAFQEKGYEKCESWEHELGYIKVALYYNPDNGHMTHAARESRTKHTWMSKMGPKNDIHHSNPYTIEGNIYGKVYCIMRVADK